VKRNTPFEGRVLGVKEVFIIIGATKKVGNFNKIERSEKMIERS
jgi:hypothetical protein